MKYLKYFEAKSMVQKIGNDIYISGDVNELPKNTLIVKTYFHKKIGNYGKIGIFACPENDEATDYGENMCYISIGKSARIISIENSYEYLKKKKCKIPVIEEENETPDDVLYKMQYMVVNILKKGYGDFDVLELTSEDDDINPHQYIIIKNKNYAWITPKNAVKLNKPKVKELSEEEIIQIKIDWLKLQIENSKNFLLEPNLNDLQIKYTNNSISEMEIQLKKFENTIKKFEKFTPIIGTGTRPELAGELVEDDGEAIIPTSMEITGKAGQPIRKVRVQKIGKKPGAKLKVAGPNYIPGIQRRNNNDGTELNSLPSQS